MDYSNLVNLALITIIYSTIVAPGLTKLDSIRDSIAEIKFPKDDGKSTGDYDAELERAGDALQRKLTTYALKHKSLRRFLKYFHAIIVMLIYAQLTWYWYIALTHKQLEVRDILILLILSIIILLLNRAIGSFMVHPSEIRSIKWLANDAGINPFNYRKLINAKLEGVVSVASVSNSMYSLKINLVLKKSFYGYRYITMVEDEDHSKLYYVATGPLNKNADTTTWYDYKNETTYSASLGSVELKPGTYKVRTLIFDAPFRPIDNSTFSPHEAVLSIAIKPSMDSQTSTTDLSFIAQSKYITSCGWGLKLKAINCEQRTSAEENVIQLLSLRRFIRPFKASNRAFSLHDINGNLDKQELDRILAPHRLFFAQLKYRFRKKSMIRLTPDN